MQVYFRQDFLASTSSKVQASGATIPQKQINQSPSNSQKYDSSVSKWVSQILYPVGAYGVLPLYFGEIKINGIENIPLDCPVILAPTHRSRWDGILVTFATGRLTTGRDLHYMVSEDELTGIQGWIIKKMGGFAVNTRCPKISSFRQSVELLKNNQMLVIFPEGGIFQDGEVHHLKNGIARIALQVVKQQPKSKIKIIPMAINYSNFIPTWRSDVKIEIGQALNVSEYLTDTIKKSTEILTDVLTANLENLS